MFHFNVESVLQNLIKSVAKLGAEIEVKKPPKQPNFTLTERINSNHLGYK